MPSFRARDQAAPPSLVLALPGSGPLARRKVIQVALPAAVAITPLLVGAFKDWSGRAGIWFWGDQALIDLEAHNSLVGRDLLGVYDRYGWHHPGPVWLQLLGVARWLGGGSPVAVSLGFYALQAVAVVAIVVVAHRLRPGLTGWWAALVLLGYEWSFGLERLGTVWAPYAIALPAALLVLLVADVAVSRDPWPATIAAAICASFLCQTDISTVVLVLVLVVAAPFLRVTSRAAVRVDALGPGDTSSGDRAWGWARNWRSRAATLAAVLGAIWLPTVVQQFSTSPGNLVQAYRFLTTHHSARTIRVSVQAADTLFGLFPFRLGEQPAKRDANPGWLLHHSVWAHPWYLAYIAGAIMIGVAALFLRKLPALALAGSTTVAILAAGWSILLVYGPLFPYLVIWTGALVIPAWVAAWLVVAPPLPSPRVQEAPDARGGASRRPRGLRAPATSVPALVVAVVGVAAAAAVCAGFAVSHTPLTDGSAHLARSSWNAVAEVALGPAVKTVYVDIGNRDAMPEAAAIADQAVRHHRRVELNRAALYFVDPSFAPQWVAQMRVVVCCGRGDPSPPAPGLTFRGQIGGQRIYVLAGGPTKRSLPATPYLRVPRVGHWREPGFVLGDVDDRRARPL